MNAPAVACTARVECSANIARLATETELCRWMGGAFPGDVAEYHCGYLAIDREALPGACGRERRALAALADRARRLADEGAVHLVQVRLGCGSYRYLAIATGFRGKGATSRTGHELGHEARPVMQGRASRREIADHHPALPAGFEPGALR